MVLDGSQSSTSRIASVDTGGFEQGRGTDKPNADPMSVLVKALMSATNGSASAGASLMRRSSI